MLQKCFNVFTFPCKLFHCFTCFFVIIYNINLILLYGIIPRLHKEHKLLPFSVKPKWSLTIWFWKKKISQITSDMIDKTILRCSEKPKSNVWNVWGFHHTSKKFRCFLKVHCFSWVQVSRYHLYFWDNVVFLWPIGT